MAIFTQAVRANRLTSLPLALAKRSGVARSAAAFMSSLDAKPGFRMPVSDYARLPKAARAVFDTMANAALRARATAASYGAGPEETAQPSVAIKASDLTRVLKTNIKAAGGGSQTADAVLTSAAGQRGLEQTTKVALNEIAGTWKTRAQASGWHAALLDVPPKIARPPRLSAAEAKAAEYRQIATDEWRKGDFAFGWPGYPERREFEASTMNTESGTVSVLRAFTYEQWLSFRTGQLQSTGQAR